MAHDAATLDARFQEMGDNLERFSKELAQARKPAYGGARQALERIATRSRGLTGEFKSLGDQLHFARNFAVNPTAVQDRASRYNNWGRVSKALPTGMNETIGSDGGVLVAPEFASTLLTRAYDNDLMSRVTLLPMGSDILSVPAVDETSRADGSRFGGVRAYWRNEAEAVAATKPSFKRIELRAEMLDVIVRVTDELQADANVGSLESIVGDICSQELAFCLGDAIVNGNGVNKPLGILDPGTAARVDVAKGAATTGQLLSENVVGMWARLHPSCRRNAIWLYDQSIEPQLFTMVIGTAGGQLAVFQPPGGLSAAPFATILGKPAIPTEFCKTLGTSGDIVLWDPSTYLMGTRGGTETAVSMHVYFLSHEQAFRFSVRVDGRAWWSSAITPKSGGATQSCIVTLQTR